MKICIFGAGISGLTVAHELIEQGYKVIVYEKDRIAGGMARSFRYKNGIPTEHSWRGYGPFYKNTFEIMKRIPIKTNKEHFTNKYTISEVEDHNTEDNLWTIYRNNVYDISHVVKSHPGGKSAILKCAGKNIETVWNGLGYTFHLNDPDIINLIKKNKVGKLVGKLVGTLVEPMNVKDNNEYDNTVFDNLNKKRLTFKYLYNESKGRGKAKLNLKDIIILFFLFGKVIFSDKRRHEYFKIRLEPIIKKYLSIEGYHYISDFLAGPGWGFDKNTMSLGHYATFVEYSLYEKQKKWQVMNKPTNEAWIDPWVTYLKSKGVIFKFNSSLQKIIIKNKIENCVVRFNNKDHIIESDTYVFALNPFNFEDIMKNSRNTKTKIYKNLNKGNTINNQISFRLGFNKKINFKMKTTGYVLIDSPYNITFYPQEDSWKKTVKLGMTGRIKTLISGTIILPYNKGFIYKKSATNLKLEYLKNEIVEQFLKSNDFMKYMNKSKVTKHNIIFKEIFSDWYENGNYLKTKNKKWVNNSSNEKYRLDNTTNITNMFICGSHCKTSINIWSMEGAVESGKLCANEILKKDRKKLATIYIHGSNRPIVVLVLQSIENIFYFLKLGNIINELIICLIIYILFNIYKTFILEKVKL